MTDEIVERHIRRLRELAVLMRNGHRFTEGAAHAAWLEEAACNYAGLVAENERLREALIRYGDRIRMATTPAYLQGAIDAALQPSDTAQEEQVK